MSTSSRKSWPNVFDEISTRSAESTLTKQAASAYSLLLMDSYGTQMIDSTFRN
jgi:hypothetical protein